MCASRPTPYGSLSEGAGAAACRNREKKEARTDDGDPLFFSLITLQCAHWRELPPLGEAFSSVGAAFGHFLSAFLSGDRRSPLLPIRPVSAAGAAFSRLPTDFSSRRRWHPLISREAVAGCGVMASWSEAESKDPASPMLHVKQCRDAESRGRILSSRLSPPEAAAFPRYSGPRGAPGSRPRR